ncbi:PLP-dependent cysteine synthase family protein [Thermoproteota archaeon]
MVQTNTLQNIFEKIGNTPLIPLNNMGSRGMKLYAKLEWFNPFGSLKDRPAYWMIKDGERKGILKRGESIIIEPTSGNTGVAMAGLCKALGYTAKMVVPKRVSAETKAILTKMGVKMIETEDDLCPRVGPGTDQAIALAEAIVKGSPKKYYMPNQYKNEANFKAHYETTGPEIWQGTDGKITHFITGIGTGGTITGVSSYLKEKNSKIKTIAVQPQRDHHLQGLRNFEESQMPDVLSRRKDVIDDWATISDKDAFNTIAEAGKKENLFLGPSSGATLRAALDVTQNIKDGVGVVIFGDSGHKYWSVFDKFNVFTKKEYDKLLNESKYLSKPLFLD